MTLKATKFTPEVLLAAPRRSAGVPNRSGEKILFTVSTYSFLEHKKTAQIKVLDARSGQSSVLSSDPALSEPNWVGEGDEFVCIKRGDKGTSSLVLGDASKPGKELKEIVTARGSISNLKLKTVDDSTVLIACSALATPEGKMYNSEADDEKVYHTGKAYSSLYVRHWDSYVTQNTNSVWFGSFKVSTSADSRALVLETPSLINALSGTSGLESPVPPFGGAGDFDICPQGIAFVSRDLDVNPATHTKSSVYIVPLDSFSQSESLPAPRPIETPGLAGYSAGPTFSPDGRRLVFTRMRSQQYESDKPRLLVVPDVWAGRDGGEVAVKEFFATEDAEGGWDARPESPLWSADGKHIYCVAEREGHGVLFRLPSDPDDAAFGKMSSPEAVFSKGTVSDVQVLTHAGGRLFVSSNSLVDSSSYFFVDPGLKTAQLLSSLSEHGKIFGLSRSQVSDFWFPGAEDYRVHALVMRPSGFDEKKKYPLAFLIHGGPQGAWNDSWSTRWNPAIFAEQGYVVVCPNPTGSTGYGMALQDGIQNQWGGRPYHDLVNCFEHIANNMPYVDIDRAVALGASYGGYMINWIQGHPLGRRFKALVCHDGVFSTLSQYSSEELFFPIHDFGGTLIENREGYERFDPAKYLDAWATPQLVIHNELDYRLCISEGLAAFNVLQSKGIPSKFLTFPDENHWVLKQENSLFWHSEILNWINKYSKVETAARG